ncbi:tetraacyldisaccharide 4'-kinase [Candidatus Babeliales bacterium]|nr:tetraacyldisaccharide 4'-kinase [Candidatus Babeliales bacterium]MCF7899535.1 tetraacyldisaccharide 4'-kinase [Candidatus Babeliales bacterium]
MKRLSNIWYKNSFNKKFSLSEKYFFIILCFLEFFYKIGFHFILFLKKNKSKPILPFKVISVGNLSAGGTGKSVFVQFLANNLLNQKTECAVVLRGYKSKIEKSKKSFLISDFIFNKKQIFCDTIFCGDEAFMLAQNLQVPVVVGKNRYKSCLLLKNKNIKTVILDDAYQNFSVNKDFEILLLDAKKPFENHHCLPAGKLREKDYSRADAIILTHADKISHNQLQNIKNNYFKNFNKDFIFAGKHSTDSLSENLINSENLQSKIIDIQKFENKKLLAFAGIGSFEYFLSSLNFCNLKISKALEYTDHYNYSEKDLILIFNLIKKNNLNGAITTQKDWYKILPIIKKIKNYHQALMPIYVLNISFEFLSKKEHNNFVKVLSEKMV